MITASTLFRRKKRLAAMAIFAVSLAMFVNACTKSEDPVSTSDRDKFLGLWQCTSTCTQSSSSPFNMTISAGNSSPEQILMDNFDGRGVKVIAYVSGANFSITGVPINIFSGDTIDGTGSYNSSTGKIAMNFTVKDGQTTDQCSASGHK
jgi:hypothetical protein